MNETAEENIKRCNGNVRATEALAELSHETGLSFGELARQLGMQMSYRDDVGPNYTEIMSGAEVGLRIRLDGWT